MHERSHRGAAVASFATLLLLLLLVVGCAAAKDAPIPAGYEDLVNGARASLIDNQEGFLRPGLAFEELRCFVNGGHVVVFREVGGPSDGRTAFTLQGPGAPVDGWGGGFGADALREEVAFNFAGVPQVDCPAK